MQIIIMFRTVSDIKAFFEITVKNNNCISQFEYGFTTQLVDLITNNKIDGTALMLEPFNISFDKEMCNITVSSQFLIFTVADKNNKQQLHDAETLSQTVLLDLIAYFNNGTDTQKRHCGLISLKQAFEVCDLNGGPCIGWRVPFTVKNIPIKQCVSAENWEYCPVDIFAMFTYEVTDTEIIITNLSKNYTELEFTANNVNCKTETFTDEQIVIPIGYMENDGNNNCKEPIEVILKATHYLPAGGGEPEEKCCAYARAYIQPKQHKGRASIYCVE